MEELNIAKIIKKVIVAEGEIILPSIGAIELQDFPATFSDDGKIINPPFKRVNFNTLRFNDDNVLARAISESGGISIEEGEDEVRKFTESVRASLSQNRQYEINGIGTIISSKIGGMEFHAAPSFEIIADSFGLRSISIEDFGSNEPADDKAPVPEEPAAEKAPAPEEPAVEEKHPEEPTGNSSGKTTSELPGKPLTESASGNRRLLIIVLWIFIAVISVIIIALLIYIFREPLRPVLEKILYNSEQLKILHYKI